MKALVSAWSGYVDQYSYLLILDKDATDSLAADNACCHLGVAPRPDLSCYLACSAKKVCWITLWDEILLKTWARDPGLYQSIVYWFPLASKHGNLSSCHHPAIIIPLKSVSLGCCRYDGTVWQAMLVTIRLALQRRSHTGYVELTHPISAVLLPSTQTTEIRAG